jgi:hypothetical protein
MKPDGRLTWPDGDATPRLGVIHLLAINELLLTCFRLAILVTNRLDSFSFDKVEIQGGSGIPLCASWTTEDLIER